MDVTPCQREFTFLMGRQMAVDLARFVNARRSLSTGEDSADLVRARMHIESLISIMERIGARREEE